MRSVRGACSSRVRRPATICWRTARKTGSSLRPADLHGLYVQEAIQQTEQAIQRAQQAGLPQLIVITGKGLHSTAHVAKIKPGPSALHTRLTV